MQFNPANDRGFVSDKPFFGKNPTYGAPISYYLSKPQTNVALRIRDAAGNQVREITGTDLRTARGAGINRVYWDLRHQPLPPAGGSAAGWRRWWWRLRWRRQQRPQRACPASIASRWSSTARTWRPSPCA